MTVPVVPAQTELDVTVVVPVMNEVGNVGPLAQEIQAALDPLELRYEIVFVDDGSTDGTAEKCLTVPGVRVVKHPRNMGQSAALMTGVWLGRGKTIVTLDGDGQNDPGSIPELLQALDEGADVAQGIRAKRHDSWSRRVAARFAYLMHHLVWRDGIVDIGCGLKAFPRQEGLTLPVFNGVHRLTSALFVFRGLKVAQVPTNHRARLSGSSKYTNIGRGLRGMWDLIGLLWLRTRLYKTVWDPSLCTLLPAAEGGAEPGDEVSEASPEPEAASV